MKKDKAMNFYDLLYLSESGPRPFIIGLTFTGFDVIRPTKGYRVVVLLKPIDAKRRHFLESTTHYRDKVTVLSLA